MKALDHHHTTTTRSHGTDHPAPGALTSSRTVVTQEDVIGIGQILDLRVGCWRPPVYVSLPRHVGDAGRVDPYRRLTGRP
jgi:hypothetical protein